MSNAAQTTPVTCQPRHFRRQWWRTAIPALFAVVMFGMFAYHIPDALWVAVSGACLMLLSCVALHGGLTVTSEGIEWYILRPKWRYRTVPWQAVRDVRRTLFGLLHPIRLIVEHGQYEPWVWGKTRPGRRMDIEIWPGNYAGGETLWNAIHQYWPPRSDIGDN